MNVQLREVCVHRINVSAKTTWRLIQVIDQDGISGWGEFTLNAPEAALSQRAATLLELSARLLNAPGNSDCASAMLDDWPVGSALFCGLDQALWDLRARLEDQSLASLLAREVLDASTTPPSAVSMYANINRGTQPRLPQAFAQRASEALDCGNRAIKIAPFDDVTPDLCAKGESGSLIEAGLARIAAVSAVIDASGGEQRAALMVDCHWRLDTATAKALIPHLRELGVSWFECPIEETAAQMSNLVTLRQAANGAGMQLAGCETMTRWEMFAPFVEGGAYDVIMPDIKYLGGYHELRRIVERCSSLGVQVSLHNPSGPIAHAASVHATAAFSLEGRLEFQFAESDLFETSVGGEFPAVRSGLCPVPAASGIGIHPDPAFLVPG